MTNFEATIRDALKSGKSLDEIGKDTAAILNQIKQEQEEFNSRAFVLEKLKKQFSDSYKKGTFNEKDAINLLAIVEAEANPDWTKEDIERFIDSEKNIMPAHVRMIKENPFKVLGETLEETLNNSDVFKVKTFLRSI